MKKKLVLLCALLCLALAFCACSPGEKSTVKSIQHSLAEGDPGRAVQVGLDYLNKHPEATDIYLRLIQIYTNDLGDAAAAEELRAKGYSVTGDPTLAPVPYETPAKPEEPEETPPLSPYPSYNQFSVGGVPFCTLTPQELDAWLPQTGGGTQTEGDPGNEGGWERTEPFPEGEIRAQYYKNDISEGLSLHFKELAPSAFGPGSALPAPGLPGGILPGDDMAAVLQKLGMPADEILWYSTKNIAEITVTEDGAAPSHNGVEITEGALQELRLTYSLPVYSGSVYFTFRGGLTGICFSKNM
ncbi:MAG: hypothetical protein IIV90_01245 [Oscillospiraceae bacterium]|nr:hypothetical protein [Oscillospiraceae bacterium]